MSPTSAFSFASQPENLAGLLRGYYLPIPQVAELARERGETYRLSASGNEVAKGHRFGGEMEPVLAAVREIAPRELARTHVETGDLLHVFLGDDGASLVTVRMDNCSEAADLTLCHAASGGFYARWQAFVAKFTTKVPRVRPRQGSSVHVLTGTPMSGYSLDTCGFEASRFIVDNYTDGVAAAMRAAERDLVAREPPGRLLLLEGPPGTGKTRAVRALLAKLNNRARVVIVPPHLIADLAGPNLIGALLGHRAPTVLVIEDADYAILDREARSEADRQGSTGALSAILNLSDGILGAQVDLRIIATTNARVAHLDAAVLRPGRLLARVEFGALMVDRVQAVAQRALGAALRRGAVSSREFFATFCAPMTLAEVYGAVQTLKRAGGGVPRAKGPAAQPVDAAPVAAA